LEPLEQQDTAIARYFALLDDGDIEGLAKLFADDARYIRPVIDTYGAVQPDVASVDGVEAIIKYFEMRGRRSYRHVIRAVATQGCEQFAEGFVQGGVGAPMLAFLACATVDSEGRIIRYLGAPLALSSAGLAAVRQPPPMPRKKVAEQLSPET
jgi:ketosteroid isomerase-like protein